MGFIFIFRRIFSLDVFPCLRAGKLYVCPSSWKLFCPSSGKLFCPSSGNFARRPDSFVRSPENSFVRSPKNSMFVRRPGNSFVLSPENSFVRRPEILSRHFCLYVPTLLSVVLETLCPSSGNFARRPDTFVCTSRHFCPSSRHFCPSSLGLRAETDPRADGCVSRERAERG